MTPPVTKAGMCTPTGTGAKATGTCTVEDGQQSPGLTDRLRETSHCALHIQYFTIK